MKGALLTRNTNMIRATVAILLALLASKAAHANCPAMPAVRFNLGQETIVNKTTDSSPCLIYLRNSSSPIYGAEIQTRPKHGSVSVSGRTTIVYVPAANYKGLDDFTFQWIGKENGITPSAATIKVLMTVN